MRDQSVSHVHGCVRCSYHVVVVECIPESVLDDSILDDRVSERLSSAHLREVERHVRHALEAARHDDVALAQRDRLRAQRHTLHAARAHLVHGRARNLVGDAWKKKEEQKWCMHGVMESDRLLRARSSHQLRSVRTVPCVPCVRTCTEGDLRRRRLSGAGRHDVTEDHLVDVLSIDLRSLQRLLDDVRTQLRRSERAQRAVKSADRRAGRAQDHHIGLDTHAKHESWVRPCPSEVIWCVVRLTGRSLLPSVGPTASAVHSAPLCSALRATLLT